MYAIFLCCLLGLVTSAASDYKCLIIMKNVSNLSMDTLLCFNKIKNLTDIRKNDEERDYSYLYSFAPLIHGCCTGSIGWDPPIKETNTFLLALLPNTRIFSDLTSTGFVNSKEFSSHLAGNEEISQQSSTNTFSDVTTNFYAFSNLQETSPSYENTAHSFPSMFSYSMPFGFIDWKDCLQPTGTNIAREISDERFQVNANFTWSILRNKIDFSINEGRSFIVKLYRLEELSSTDSLQVLKDIDFNCLENLCLLKNLSTSFDYKITLESVQHRISDNEVYQYFLLKKNSQIFKVLPNDPYICIVSKFEMRIRWKVLIELPMEEGLDYFCENPDINYSAKFCSRMILIPATYYRYDQCTEYSKRRVRISWTEAGLTYTRIGPNSFMAHISITLDRRFIGQYIIEDNLNCSFSPFSMSLYLFHTKPNYTKNGNYFEFIYSSMNIFQMATDGTPYYTTGTQRPQCIYFDERGAVPRENTNIFHSILELKFNSVKAFVNLSLKSISCFDLTYGMDPHISVSIASYRVVLSSFEPAIAGNCSKNHYLKWKTPENEEQYRILFNSSIHHSPDGFWYEWLFNYTAKQNESECLFASYIINTFNYKFYVVAEKSIFIEKIEQYSHHLTLFVIILIVVAVIVLVIFFILLIVGCIIWFLYQSGKSFYKGITNGTSIQSELHRQFPAEVTSNSYSIERMSFDYSRNETCIGQHNIVYLEMQSNSTHSHLSETPNGVRQDDVCPAHMPSPCIDL